MIDDPAHVIELLRTLLAEHESALPEAARALGKGPRELADIPFAHLDKLLRLYPNGKLAATSRRVGLSFMETNEDPFNPGTDVDLSPGQTDREMHGRVSYIGGDGRYVTILWNAEGSGTPSACNVWGVAFA